MIYIHFVYMYRKKQVFAFEMSLLYLSELKIFLLDLFNEKLLSFKYSFNDKCHEKAI